MKVSEDRMHRLAEAARDSGMRINEEARQLVEEGQSADFYRGYVSGVAGIVTLCRCFLKSVGEAVDADLRHGHGVETAVIEHSIIEVVELMTMHMAAPAAAAAERYLQARNQNR
ncbi:MAG: hypothetical protein H0W76_13360 [Pyrinomonadaceae bacterium]|nr:hypothetical protein [Pyrinomonadaceae bacterium]